MNRKKIENKVKEIISKELGVKIENITTDKRLIEDFGMDSFNAIEIGFEIKDKFGVEIAEDDFKKIKKFKDLLEYILEHITQN
ncbi:MAG: acyl carrier protein [Candidatus Omnitrophica bacterium]|nr:acyl carrier protein [Candidatus Omnitrophota bacterium]MCM8825936.1 acyl carrier protein [Candidatus Omnitrophota bacterium]